jgi:hypothetical protein
VDNNAESLDADALLVVVDDAGLTNEEVREAWERVVLGRPISSALAVAG